MGLLLDNIKDELKLEAGKIKQENSIVLLELHIRRFQGNILNSDCEVILSPTVIANRNSLYGWEGVNNKMDLIG